MKDYIKYSGENLAAAASQLGRLSNTMSDVADMLSTVDTSAGWWTKIGLRTNDGGARETVQAGRRSANAIRQKTENTISGIRKTRETFDEVERNIDLGGTGKDQSVYRNSGNGVIVPSAETGAPATSTDKKTTSKFWEFLKKIIGGTSGIGKMIEGIAGLASAKNWTSTGKAITKIVQGGVKAADEIPKWVKSIKDWKSAKDTVEEVGKAAVATGSTAVKWADKFDSAMSNPVTWIFSGITAAFDTAEDYQNQRYKSVDDYAVKWATRTATDVTIKAAVTTTITAGLVAAGMAAGGWTVVVAGAATAAVVYGGDCLVKWASKGTYSGMADAISDVAVKRWEFKKQVAAKATEAISTFWSNTVGNIIPSF